MKYLYIVLYSYKGEHPKKINIRAENEEEVKEKIDDLFDCDAKILEIKEFIDDDEEYYKIEQYEGR